MERVIEELLAAARAAGVDTREIEPSENSPRSGLAYIKGKPVLFLRKDLLEEEKLGFLKEALQSADLDNVYLTPAAREIVFNNNQKE